MALVLGPLALASQLLARCIPMYVYIVAGIIYLFLDTLGDIKCEARNFILDYAPSTS